MCGAVGIAELSPPCVEQIGADAFELSVDEPPLRKIIYFIPQRKRNVRKNMEILVALATSGGVFDLAGKGNPMDFVSVGIPEMVIYIL